MKYLLDTNACIRFLNGQSDPLHQRILSASPSDLLLCAVVKAELFYGAMKSHHPTRTLTRQQKFVGRFVSLPFDDKAAEIYGEIRTELEQKGTPIGPYDLQIAAIALANEITLVSHNTREFKRINRLLLEDWEVTIL